MYCMRPTSIYPLQSGLIALAQVTVYHPRVHTTTIGSIAPHVALAGTMTLMVKPMVIVRIALRLVLSLHDSQPPHNLQRPELGSQTPARGPRASLQVNHSELPA
jgi:hypothetical protein